MTRGPKPTPVIDRLLTHTCGKCTRGVLCPPCNVALGMLTEAGVERAQAYILAARRDRDMAASRRQ